MLLTFKPKGLFQILRCHWLGLTKTYTFALGLVPQRLLIEPQNRFYIGLILNLVIANDKYDVFPEVFFRSYKEVQSEHSFFPRSTPQGFRIYFIKKTFEQQDQIQIVIYRGQNYSKVTKTLLQSISRLGDSYDPRTDFQKIR